MHEPTPPTPPAIGAFAIVPCNDLPGAIGFWEEMGFAPFRRTADYALLRGWGCEVHLSQAGRGPWAVRAEANPFGVYLRTPEVAAIAARMDAHVIRPGGVLGHRAWGLYEVGIAGPDGLLIRVGWPSPLVAAAD